MNNDAVVVLKRGREKSVLRHHPWIFSGSIESFSGSTSPGDTVRIQDSQQQFLGWGSINQKSKIAIRVWSWNEDERIEPALIHARLQAAFELRKSLFPISKTDSFRWFFSEADGIPGLVIDKYADQLVAQFSTAGAEKWRAEILRSTKDISRILDCFDRSEPENRKQEGLPPCQGVLFGSEKGHRVEIQEWGIRYLVDIHKGQKTGFYLDQRLNRLKLRDFCKGKRVLNCFCYTGGFSLNAAAAGAEKVISIDSSGEAIQMARENAELNYPHSPVFEWVEGDVFMKLREFRDEQKKFDVIILDPPKFAPTIKSVEKAARAYKDINLLAFKNLNPGGTLFTFSCSGGINPDLFQKIVFGASADAHRTARIQERLQQDLDHPIPLHFPEAEYLKGLVCRVVN